MIDEETTQTPSNEVTSEYSNPVTPSDTSEGNVNNNDTSESTNTSTHANSENVGDNNKKREDGKISKLEKDNANLVKWIAADSGRYAQALRDAGHNESQIESLVKQVHPNYQSNSNDKPKKVETSKTEFNSNLSPEYQKAIDGIVSLEKQKDLSRREAAGKFYEDHSNVTQNEGQAIALLAMQFENEGKKPEDAIKLAGQRVLSPESFKKEGFIEGRGRQLASTGTSSIGGAGGKDLSIEGGSSITSEDEAVMKMLKLTTKEQKEAYIKNKNS